MTADIPKLVANNIGSFTGRIWLLPKLLEWWTQRDDPLFLLMGGPGTGKSMITAWLAGSGPVPATPSAQRELERLRGVVKATYFCQSTGLNTPRLFAESVANQLANNVPNYRDALKSILEDRVQIVGRAQAGTAATGSSLIGVDVTLTLGDVGDEFGFDQAFIKPLRKLYEDGYREPILLLIDALDEAQTYTGVTLPDLLSRRRDVPAGVRVLATTRNDPRVRKLFQAVKPLDLVRDADPSVDDVFNYGDGRLAGLSAVNVAKRKAFAERLAKQADGVFLYAAMVLDELIARSTTALPDLDTYPLPAGLGGLYHEFLNRELGKDEARWFDLYEPLLGLIAVGQGAGLTGEQLTAVVRRDVRPALRACKQYLDGELPDGPFRPFHKSFADFLLEDEDNVDYHIDAGSMHRRIADHYWAYRENGSECDDYGLRSLAIHLFRSAQYQRVFDLLGEQWMHERVKRYGYRYDGFVTDVLLAWTHARQEALREINAGKEPGMLATCVRCALLQTSVTSLSARHEPALVRRAVETGVWPFTRALSVVSKVHTSDRARWYRAVLRDVSREPDRGGQLDEGDDEQRRALADALKAAREINDPEPRAEALSVLAGHLSEPERTTVLNEALTAGQSIGEANPRIATLSTLVPLLGERKDLALRTAVSTFASWAAGDLRDMRGTKMPGAPERLEALATLATHLEGPLLDEALAIARRLPRDEPRVFALAALVPRLTGPKREVVVREALTGLRAVADWIPQVLDTLQPQLVTEALVTEALTLVRTVATDDAARARALSVLAPRLSGALVPEALSIAYALTESYARAEALRALAPQVNESERQNVVRDALASARHQVAEGSGTNTLVEFAGQMRGAALADAASIAREMTDKRSAANIFVSLAQRLVGWPEQAACVREALIKGKEIDDSAHAQILEALAPSLLDQPLLDEALRDARSISEVGARAVALSALGARLAGAEQNTVMREALEAARRSHPWTKRHILETLAPHLDGALLDDALSLGTIEDTAACARVLAAFAQEVNQPQRNVLLRDALEAVVLTADEFERAEQLVELVPQLSETLLAEAVSIPRPKDQALSAKVATALAKQLEGPQKAALISDALMLIKDIDASSFRRRAELLADLASELSGSEKDWAVREALFAARSIDGIGADEVRKTILLTLAPDVSELLLPDAVAVARDMDVGDERASAIGAFVTRLPAHRDRLCHDELQSVQGERSSWRRATALAALAPCLSDLLRDRALSLARQIDYHPAHKVKVLTAIAASMAGTPRDVIIAEALSIVDQMTRDQFYAASVAVLVPLLTEPNKGRLLAGALSVERSIEGDEPRAEILAALAPYLNEELLAEALSDALQLQEEHCRARAVERIASSASLHVELRERLLRYVLLRLEEIVTKGERRELYDFCRNEQLFRPPFVTAEVVEQLGKDIADIGIRWRWP